MLSITLSPCLSRTFVASEYNTKSSKSNISQPRYIEGLLKTAELRKRDRLRAEEKMVEKEREREGEEFADKEKFVTQA